MKFKFQAKDQDGVIKEGIIEAVNEGMAVQTLQRNNLVPLSIEQVKKISALMRELKRAWEGVTQKEMAIFFRQLATLIEAKVPIVQSLAAIEEQTGNKFLRLTIQEMADDIREGMPFSESLSKHPLAFSPLSVSIIRAGEVSGNLQQAITFVAESIEKSYRLNSRIRSALIYPAFVIIVAFIIGFITISYILPKLAGVIRELNVEIPWYTKVLMAVGDFMSSYWWAVLAVILGLVGGLIYYIKTETGRREWDQIEIKLPIVGGLFRAIALARFSDNLSLMIMAGIPIVRALNIIGDVVGNSVYQSVILRAADEVKTGGHISTILAKSSDIPPIVAQMVRIGEETGKLGEVLKGVTDFYDQEIDKTSRNITTMIEPVLIVILGLGVAVLVFAILMPIYNIAGKM